MTIERRNQATAKRVSSLGLLHSLVQMFLFPCDRCTLYTIWEYLSVAGRYAQSFGNICALSSQALHPNCVLDCVLRMFWPAFCFLFHAGCASHFAPLEKRTV